MRADQRAIRVGHFLTNPIFAAKKTANEAVIHRMFQPFSAQTIKTKLRAKASPAQALSTISCLEHRFLGRLALKFKLKGCWALGYWSE
jgi:hypothetical protein